MGLVEKEIVLTSKDANGNTVVHKPYTNVGQVEGAVATVNGIAPDDNGNVEIEVGGVKAHQYGAVRNRDSSKPTYGLS